MRTRQRLTNAQLSLLLYISERTYRERYESPDVQILKAWGMIQVSIEGSGIRCFLTDHGREVVKLACEAPMVAVLIKELNY